MGTGGDDEENDPNRDKKWKRPHKEEVPPSKGKRASKNHDLMDSSIKGRQSSHTSLPGVSSKYTHQNIDHDTPSIDLTVEEIFQ